MNKVTRTLSYNTVLLDPTNDTGIALPPDPKLLAELCAPRFTLSGKAIKVESREDIVKRLGYSPDRATAVILASIDQPKVAAMRASRLPADWPAGTQTPTSCTAPSRMFRSRMPRV